MILTGRRIVDEIEKGTIAIEPFNTNQLGPNSYNLRLASQLMVYRTNCPTFTGVSQTILDCAKPPVTDLLTIDQEDGILLVPGTLYLGRTVEYTATDHFVPMIEGRSSLGRLGVNIHITAGFGDVGFAGTWTLEISVIHPIYMYAGIEICQIYFHEVAPGFDGGFDLYKGSYSNSNDIKPSKLHREIQGRMREE